MMKRCRFLAQRKSIGCWFPSGKWTTFVNRLDREAKAFVAEQRQRFADIENYPRELSANLRRLRDDLVQRMRMDVSDWEVF
jgi:hypothetical protein